MPTIKEYAALALNEYYYLNRNGETTLAYLYVNPNTKEAGFGFNIADGGGFLPLSDLTPDTSVQVIKIVPKT